MESVCDKPQAARTRGPKIRVVGAIRVDNPQSGRAECRGKALQAILDCFPYRGRCPRLPTSASRRVLPSRQGFVLHSSLKFFTLLLTFPSVADFQFFTLHLSNGLCFIVLCIIELRIIYGRIKKSIILVTNLCYNLFFSYLCIR